MKPVFWGLEVVVPSVAAIPDDVVAVAVVAVAAVAVASVVVASVVVASVGNGNGLFPLFAVEEQEYEGSKCDSKKVIVMKICTNFIVSYMDGQLIHTDTFVFQNLKAID